MSNDRFMVSDGVIADYPVLSHILIQGDDVDAIGEITKALTEITESRKRWGTIPLEELETLQFNEDPWSKVKRVHYDEQRNAQFWEKSPEKTWLPVILHVDVPEDMAVLVNHAGEIIRVIKL